MVILPVSLTLITRATRRLPAPEANRPRAALVWLAIRENPSPEVLAGGVLVVSAVTIHSALSTIKERASSGRD